MIDAHCHILWGVDDASKVKTQSIDMLRVAIADGVTHIIATSHIKEPIFNNSVPKLRKAYESLLMAIKEENLEIEVSFGAENFLAKHTMYLLKKGGFIPLGNSPYMLVEFAWTINIHDDINLYLKQIIDAGYIPVIAHPERYEWVHKDYSLITKWRSMGCLMQVNRTSALGLDRMENANIYAKKMLDDDLVDLIASDAHFSFSPRLPKLSDAYRYVEKNYGKDKAERYFIHTPAKFI